MMLAASLSLFLAWRQIYYVSKQYLYFKRKAVGHSESEEEMTTSRFKGHTHW